MIYLDENEELIEMIRNSNNEKAVRLLEEFIKRHDCSVAQKNECAIPDVSVSLPSDAEIEAEICEEFPAPLCGLDKETMSDEYIRYLNAVHWAKFGRDFKGN